ncbi:MAG TPA: hypothetical protein VIW03_02465 [Anaeromyxobacter sp.]
MIAIAPGSMGGLASRATSSARESVSLLARVSSGASRAESNPGDGVGGDGVGATAVGVGAGADGVGTAEGL